MGEVFKEVPAIGKPLGALISRSFNALLSANQSHITGGLQLAPLPYDQARELARAVAGFSGRRVALVLDAWEKSPNPALAAEPLQGFIDHPDDWPRCHVFLSLRPDAAALQAARDLIASHPGRAALHELREMDVADPKERGRLLRFLEASVPATAQAGSEDVLDLVGGFPGVVAHWTSGEQKLALRSREDLARAADDAQHYRFRELERLLAGLRDQPVRLAIRIALVPLAANPDAWNDLRPVILEGFDGEMLDGLKAQAVLEQADPPGFGHATRGEVALAHLIREQPNGVRRQAEQPEIGLACRVKGIEAGGIYPSQGLRGLLRVARPQKCHALALALCQSANRLWEETPADGEMLCAGIHYAREVQVAGVEPLLAMGLFNTLNDAKAEDALARRDALLDELRALAAAHPGEAILNGALALAERLQG